VVVLRGHETGAAAGPGRELRLGDLPSGEVRVPVVADLPLPDEVVERVDRLGDRRVRVGEMELVEVYPVCAQTAQRLLDGATDVAARPHPSREVISHVVVTVAELRGQDHAVPAPFEGLAHQRLAETGVLAVDVRGVQERD
ncbi:hypothetical protein ABE10_02530, partial [Bacillus toyonensis]|nr:hypothetical protein [Bacillus toyonensis]